MIKKILNLVRTELASGAVRVVLATICSGAISYLVLFVASRVVGADEVARFVSIWAVVNTIVLAFVLPVDTYAPRLRLDLANLGKSDVASKLIRSYAIAIAALFSIGFIVFVILGRQSFTVSELLAIMSFALAAALFGGEKALLGSAGDFQRVFLQAVLALIVSTAMFLVAVLVPLRSWSFLFTTIAIAYAFSTIIVRQDRLIFRRPNWGLVDNSLRNILRETGALRSMSSLISITLITLLLGNGALICARSVGASPNSIVVYAAMLNLAMVPCMLLNALTPPIHVRLIRTLRTGTIPEARRLYNQSFGLYATIVLCIIGGAGLIGPIAVRLYVGSEYRPSTLTCLGIAAAEAIATLTVLPRIFLTALGLASSISRYWILGLAFFSTVMLLPIEPSLRLIIAPLSASVVVLLFTHRYVGRNLSTLMK